MQNMARGISSIVTTAVAAGAIGFAAGVYLVPKENANQFRAIVRDGLSAIFRIVRSDKANPDTHLLGSPKRRPLRRRLVKNHKQMSQGDRGLALMRNAIPAIGVS